MIWDKVIILAREVILVLMFLGAVVLGYWMGRNSADKTMSSQPKQFDPGPKGVEVDPYAEALERLPMEGRRIPTI